MELSFEQIMQREAAQKKQIYHDLNQSALPGQIVMAGSSLMEQFPINELLMSSGRHIIVYNRGLGGFTTEQYLETLDVCVLELKPRKVFINIGTNDIGATEGWQETLIANYREILCRIRAALPDCKIIVMAYYPVANTGSPFCPPNAAEPRILDKVLLANRLVRELADELDLSYIDVNHAIADENGYLKAEYAKDPVHMWPCAYREILKALMPYFKD